MRYLIALASALLLASALVGVAAAAPENSRKASTIDVSCDQGFGDLQVLTLENESVVAWTSDAHFVAKQFEGEFTGTVTTLDGNTYSHSDSFVDELARGGGFEKNRTLIHCTFSETFSETFPLDEQTAADFGIPSSYIGQDVTFQGTFEGEATVVQTGKS